MSRWATPPLDRDEAVLFPTTVDDRIPDDHPVRLFDEVLRGMSFVEWESMYVLVAGQPPIHPRVMAACILYGLSLGIRSSRRLEDAAGNRIDFMWLMNGRVPDHATICEFRKSFGPQLKALFRQIGRVGIEMGLITLNQLTLDGTDTRSCNSRYNTARRATLEQKMAALDAQVERALAEAAERDRAEDELFGVGASPTKLPRELKNLQRRQEKLRETMKRIEQMEQERAGRKDVSPKGPAVPLADPDSRVLPNKGGGHAPNYTSVLAVDVDSGMIVDAQVLGGNDEASTVLPAIEHIEQNFGAKPKQLDADSGFNSGENLTGLEARGVEPLMPAKQSFAQNPAVGPDRPDPSQPVPPEKWGQLPINPQNKILDKAAFVYDATADRYTCPMGQPLERAEDKPYNRHGNKGTYRIYESPTSACAACPLSGKCLPKGATERRVSRDEHEEARERMAERLGSEAGQAQYARRAPVAEGTFGILKSQMNLRQFLLRGLKKVGHELYWAVTAFNLMKLMRHKADAAAAAAGAAARAAMPVATPQA